MTVQVKRIYDPPARSDGIRILVDRLWPRGVKKADARIDLWLKDVAPSTSLRRWFDHRPERWEKFCERYLAELSNNAVIDDLRALINKEKRVTLLYSARDEHHNQAVVLADYFKTSSRGKPPRGGFQRPSAESHRSS